MKTCSGVSPVVGSLTDSKMELELPGSAAGAPGSAGKSSFDIWNSEEWSAGCFTMPTGRRHFYENLTSCGAQHTIIVSARSPESATGTSA